MEDGRITQGKSRVKCGETPLFPDNQGELGNRISLRELNDLKFKMNPEPFYKYFISYLIQKESLYISYEQKERLYGDIEKGGIQYSRIKSGMLLSETGKIMKRLLEILKDRLENSGVPASSYHNRTSNLFKAILSMNEDDFFDIYAPALKMDIKDVNDFCRKVFRRAPLNAERYKEFLLYITLKQVHDDSKAYRTYVQLCEYYEQIKKRGGNPDKTLVDRDWLKEADRCLRNVCCLYEGDICSDTSIHPDVKVLLEEHCRSVIDSAEQNKLILNQFDRLMAAVYESYGNEIHENKNRNYYDIKLCSCEEIQVADRPEETRGFFDTAAQEKRYWEEKRKNSYWRMPECSCRQYIKTKKDGSIDVEVSAENITYYHAEAGKRARAKGEIGIFCKYKKELGRIEIPKGTKFVFYDAGRDENFEYETVHSYVVSKKNLAGNTRIFLKIQSCSEQIVELDKGHTPGTIWKYRRENDWKKKTGQNKNFVDVGKNTKIEVIRGTTYIRHIPGTIRRLEGKIRIFFRNQEGFSVPEGTQFVRYDRKYKKYFTYETVEAYSAERDDTGEKWCKCDLRVRTCEPCELAAQPEDTQGYVKAGSTEQYWQMPGYGRSENLKHIVKSGKNYVAVKVLMDITPVAGPGESGKAEAVIRVYTDNLSSVLPAGSFLQYRSILYKTTLNRINYSALERYLYGMTDSEKLAPISVEEFGNWFLETEINANARLRMKTVEEKQERKRSYLLTLIFLLVCKDRAIGGGDRGKRFKEEADRMLQKCQLPTLYRGNPYDYLLLYLSGDSDPVESFRQIWASVKQAKTERRHLQNFSGQVDIFNTCSPMTRNTLISSKDFDYYVESVLGYGGNSIIYRAVKCQNGQREVGTEAALKEVFPSPKNGIFTRNANGQVVPGMVHRGHIEPADEGTMLFEEGYTILDDLYERLEKEEEIGHHLRDSAFLVCNLKILQEAEIDGVRVKGIAEMSNMNFSSIVLKRRIQQLTKRYNNRIPVKRSLNILKEISETMKKLHQSGYLYCDVSPNNIFLLEGDTAAVFIDFGSAVENDGEDIETEEFIAATPGYRAPEIVGDGLRVIGESSDIYSIVVLFYEMISGHPFFSGNSEREFERAQMDTDRLLSPERMRKIGIPNPTAALLLNQLLMDGLQYDRKERIQSIDDLNMRIRKIEEAIQKEDHLFEALILAHQEMKRHLREKCSEQRQAQWNCLQNFFIEMVPDTDSMLSAMEQMSKKLHGGYDIEEISYIYHWICIWFERCKEKFRMEDVNRMNYLMDYCAVAVYNHRGDYQMAISHFEDYRARKAEFHLEEWFDIRLRIAETYAIMFDYKKAYELAMEEYQDVAKCKEEDIKMAAKRGRDTEHMVRSEKLGKYASAAARYCVFNKKYNQALDFFKIALGEFSNNVIQTERVNCSVMQMAIDSGNRELYEEYLLKVLAKYNISEPDDTLDGRLKCLLRALKAEPLGQTAYDMYAFLKGVRAFHGDEVRDTFLNNLKLLQNNVSFPERNHPWELIYRQAAILLAEHERKMSREAENLFRKSISIPAGLSDWDEQGEIVHSGYRVFQHEDSERDLRENKFLPFNTIIVLHRVTLIEYYYYAMKYADKKDKNMWENFLNAALETLYIYLHECNTRFINRKAWERCKNTMERYELIRSRFTYEYY